MKIGLLGHVGQFSSADGRIYARNAEVVCRTNRGLEVGVVLCPLESDGARFEPDGTVLRQVTPDDRLIISRIDRFRDRAFAACNRLISRHHPSAVLVDVEHLFDGQSLYFYFLGEVPDEVHELTGQLADEYEKKVRFRKFTETLASGCGPECGTGTAGCGSGSCGSCTLKENCGAK